MIQPHTSPTTAADPRSDLFLTFAVTFRPPFGAAFFSSFTADLALDLAEMWRDLALPGAEAIGEFQAAARAVGSADDLLVTYSRLFLTPPVRVPLNAGLYLDGSVMGGSVAELEALYARHGLVQSSDFRDLPDHLSMVLEFAAHLAGRGDAKELAAVLHRFLRPWMTDLTSRLSGEDGSGPYAPLAILLAEAMQALCHHGEQKAPARRMTRPEALIGKEGESAGCIRCGQPFLRDKQLRKLAAVLEAQGLAADHLDTCPECRDSAMGFTTKTLPKVVRGRLERRGKGECE